MEVIGQLTTEEYQGWLFELTKYQLAQEKNKTTQLQLGLMIKDLEMLKLRTELYKTQTVQASIDQMNKTKENYEKYLVEFEQKTGLTLKDVAINEETLEVSKV
jgi:hypothetical protein